MNLFNEKLEQLEKLQSFLAKLEAKGYEIYKPTIEATKKKINELIGMISTYVNAENEEEEEKQELTKQQYLDNIKRLTTTIYPNLIIINNIHKKYFEEECNPKMHSIFGLWEAY
jgi:endo-alpha-1,4-polygalactosaminidase (GH114 family)